MTNNDINIDNLQLAKSLLETVSSLCTDEDIDIELNSECLVLARKIDDELVRLNPAVVDG